jgi:hypothetical protein
MMVEIATQIHVGMVQVSISSHGSPTEIATLQGQVCFTYPLAMKWDLCLSPMHFGMELSAPALVRAIHSLSSACSSVKLAPLPQALKQYM